MAHHIRTYSPSTRASLPEWDRMMQFRNRYLMIAKNDPLASLLRDLPRILAYEVAALGFAMLRERHLLRGYVDAGRLLPRMLRSARVLQQRRRGAAARRPRRTGSAPTGLKLRSAPLSANAAVRNRRPDRAAGRAPAPDRRPGPRTSAHRV